MITPRLSLLSLLLSFLTSSADAFAFCSPRLTCSFASTVRPSTWLRAEAEEEGAEEEPEEPEEAKKADTGGSDILNSPAFLKRKLEVIKSDISKAEEDLEDAKVRLEEGRKEWGAQFEELEREYQNIQDRMNTQSKSGDAMAIVQVARQMLEALDNFDRAFGAVTPETDSEKEIEAEYKQAYELILETFSKLGVEAVETVGKEFDYEYHQAVMQKPSDEYEEGIVCEELQKGFKLDETLIRAAMVVVAA